MKMTLRWARIGQRTQDLKYEGEPTHLVVGEGNTFREFVTVNRGTSPGASTVVGSRGNFLAYSHIAHDCVVGDDVIFSNNGTIAGHVTVGNHVILGGLTAVHQFRDHGWLLEGCEGCASVLFGGWESSADPRHRRRGIGKERILRG